MNMQKKKSLVTRGFALFLALVFCLGLMPLTAITAYAEEPEPIQTAEPEESPALSETPAPVNTGDSEEPEETETPETSEDSESSETPVETEETAEENKPLEITPVAGVGSLDGVNTTSRAGEIMLMANGESIEAMHFSWNGTAYTMMTNSSGSGTGISWTCDEDGNFTMDFTADGTLVITMGTITNSSVKLIGGGAGGSSAYGSAYGNGHGGNGGGGGSIVESEISIEEGVTINVKVGAGGKGGSPSTVGPEYTITGSSGTAGGDTVFGSITAAGGQPDAGGSGADDTGPGSAAASNSRGGGGGGSVSTFYETDCGNFRWGNFSCFICGTNSGDYNYNVGGWTPIYQNATNPGDVSGGSGDNGGGTGGYPQNEHGHGPRTGGNGADGTGAGGGGGAYATWVYCLGNGYGHSSSYSAEGLGYAGAGGNGGRGAATLSGHAEAKVRVQITKTSSNPAMTSDNSCYSLQGAVYGIYSDAACTNLLEELTTDANGQVTSARMERGNYYIKEISASKGYLLDSTVYTADASSGNVAITVKETPADDPVAITITKITDDTATTLPSLEGTQFTIKFYGGQYSSVDELPSTPLRTWVIETKADTRGNKTIYRTALDESYIVSGSDDLYYNNNQVVIPLGTITVQETSPAKGYTTIGGYVNQSGQTLSDADGIILLNVTEDMSLASGGGLNYGNEYTKSDKPIYGGVSIQKWDAETRMDSAQGGASLAGAELKIISLNETDVTVDGQVYAKGQVVYSGTTDENGSFVTAADLLPMGKYKIVETTAPEGYQLAGTLEQEFEISVDGVIVDLTAPDSAISDQPIRADFSLEKQDGDSKKPMANVLFEITSTTTGESYTFYTDANGFFTSSGSSLRFGADGEGGALLYDTYIIQELECEANQGYTLADPITLVVTGENTMIQVVGIYNYQMRMQTTAEFRPSGLQWSLASGTVTARDTVSYENLLANTQYTLVGKLWNKSAESFLTDADGNEIATEKTFVTTARAGVQTMEFTFSADTLAGADIVVFEYLYIEGKDEPILTHADPEDEGQTLHFPAIGTSARDGENGSSVSLIAEEISITDTVKYENLIPGEEYTVKGTLMDAATGETALDAEGKEIHAQSTFVADLKDGFAQVTFTFKGNFETAQKFVAFEELYYKGNLLAVHTDIEDEEQTIYIPKIGTSAQNAETGKQIIMAEENVSILDTVRYEGLKSGLEYTVAGKIVLQADTETVLSEAELTFTPDSEDGEVEMSLPVDASVLAGETVVVFEAVYLDGALVAHHEDADAEEQTIYIPEIGTSAADTANGGPVSLMAEEISITDTVRYKGLKPGEEYTVKGTLMDAATGETALDAEGNAITAETVFIPESKDGFAEVTFVFKGNFETAKKFVAFEELYYDDILVAIHADIEDDEQTIYIPKIGTTAISPITGDHLGTAGEMTVIDTVSYEGLKPGLEYVMYGLVVAADSPETILGGAMSAFIPETENGTEELELNVNAEDYAGKTVVIYESILLNGAVVAVHQDAEDLEQSILIPSIQTQARDAELGGNTAIADEDVTIIDTVKYENLIPGKEYTISGALVLKSAPETVLAEAELTFTPEEQRGEVELSFTLDGSNLAGEAAVAFEELRYNGVTIAVHADIEDANQTVIFPSIQTTATVEGIHQAQARDNVTLRDAVAYTNLTAGEIYTVCGVLMDKATGKPILDANGKEIRAESSFTADAASGTTWLSFVFNGSNLEGKTVVAFERLYLGTDTTVQPIAVHEDIGSVEQSVEFATSIPKTGDESNIALWAALAAISLAAAGTAMVLLRKKAAGK